AFLEAIKGSAPAMDECDVVVPRDAIPVFVRRSVAIGKEFGVRILSFGHAGDGNLHIYVCRDGMTDEEWKDKVTSAMDRLYDEAKALRGEVSGEHGIGPAKMAYLRDSVGERQIALMRGIKAAFDPKGILNPGKVAEG
ncbi:MAG: 2-hydroxy-acid oxidase, partial [Clostridia bacterium]|nr:2-hydroxy-acid oxidase [Clostridia bacterium]